MGEGNGNFQPEWEGGDEEAEEWCFVCKEGGGLLLCDHKNCPKAFHPHCVGKKKSFMSSEEHWKCAWHSCTTCGNPSNLRCYGCPKSVCSSCMDPKCFFHIKGKYGFCDECIELALEIEGNKGKKDVEDLTYFKGYYEFVKEREGFDLYSLRSAKGFEMKKVHIPTPNSGDMTVHCLDNDHDRSVVSKNNGKLVEDKGCQGQRKKKVHMPTSNSGDAVVHCLDNDHDKRIVSKDNGNLVEDKGCEGQQKKKVHMATFNSGDAVVHCLDNDHDNSVVSKDNANLVEDEGCKGQQKKKVHMPTSNSGDAVVHCLDNDHDKSVVSKDNGKLVEDKRCEGQQKRKFNNIEAPDEDPVMRSGTETLYASIVSENINLVYLTKSLVLELLKKPESFESKVIGSYVRVKYAVAGGSQSNSHQLVQVVGITKDSSDIPIKLQLRDMPSDLRIDLLTDGSLHEEECEALRLKFEAGLLAKPTVEELEHKAKDLHSDLTKLKIARELKNLKFLIDIANEKGWRNKLMEHLERKERLETESEVRRMLNTFPKVIAEVPKVKPVANDTTDDKKRKRGLPKTRHISMDVEDTKETVVGLSSIPAENWGNKRISGTKGTIVSNMVRIVEDEVVQEPISNRIDLQEKSSGDVAASDAMLDELIRPDLLNCLDTVPSEVINHITKGCILALKGIPISNYKDMMIPLANGFFVTLRNLNFNYTQLYGRVRDYIRCSAQLSRIDNTEKGPTLEELSAAYGERKLCYENNSEAFNVISNPAHESNKQLVLVEEGNNHQAENEVSGERTEVYVSRISILIKMYEELEKSKKEMVQTLDALDKGRKKWLEEEKVKEDFTSAKAALIW